MVEGTPGRYQAGTAFVPIVPSLRGFQKTVKSELAGMKIQATGEVKLDVNKASLAAAVAAVDKATEQVAAARGKEADAAGVVRAAEAKLLELRESGKAKAAQLVAAEERLESARRKLAAATEVATKAQAGLAAAEKKAADAKTTADAPEMPDPVATAAGTRAGGKFAAALRKQIDGALDALPTPVITADSTPAEREIAGLRQQLTALGDAKVGVDISAEQANARLDEIKARLLALGASSADLEVQVDSAAALAALGGVQQQVDQLDGDTARVAVDADSGAAISGLNGVFTAGMKLGALVPVIAGVGAALAGIGAGAVVGVGALGVAALALNGIGGAYSALGDAELSAGDDAAAGAKSQASAAAAVASAQDRVVSSTRALENARAQAADAQIRAEQRVTQAETNLVKAQRDALRAQQDLNDARLEAQRALEDLAFRVEDGALAQRQAVLDLADAEQALKSVRQDPKATARQQEEAVLAYERAANQLERLQVENKRLAVDKAAADKAGVEGSEQVVRAQEQVGTSAERVASAQQAMADAVREQAAQQRQAAYSIEQAQQGVIEAQRSLQQALANTGDIGSASARKVRDAFAELSPVQAEFATFLFTLRPLFDGLKTAAADGFLKPLQVGLQALVPVMPVIEKVVGQLAGALGGLAQQALEALASPYWVEFFTMLGNTAGPIMQAFGDTLGQVAMLFGDLVKAFLPVAPVAFDVINALAEGLRILAPFLGEVARVLTQGLLTGLQALLPAMAPVGEALVALAAPIGELAGQLGQVLAAALIAIVPIITELAPPLTDLVKIVGSALLGAIKAIAPVITELAPRLGDIATILVGSLGKALEKVLPYLDDIALVLGKALVGAVDALMPVLPDLTEAWLAVLDAVVPLIPDLLKLAETLLPTLLDLIPVLTPVLTDVAKAFAEILPELIPIVTKLTDGLLPVIEALAPSVIVMAEIFSRSFEELFNGIIVPLLENIVIPAIEVLADILTWLWQYVAAPAFEGIGAVVTWAWENVIRPGFDALKDGLDAVGSAFQSAVDFIRESWDGLKEAAAAPINFIIEWVYTKGIKLMWDSVAGLVPGMKMLPDVKPIVFAGGGVLGGYAPGVDIVPALLSPGEAVLVPELVRALGPANILAANAAASGGRPATLAGDGLAMFAGGGLVDKVLGFTSGLGENVTAMFRDPIGWIKANIGVPDAPWVDMAATLSSRTIDNAFKELNEKLNPFAMSSTASGKVGGGVASNAQLDAWIRAAMAFAGVDSSWYSGLLTLIMRESGGNPNAINLWDINAQNGVPSQGLMQTIPPTFAAYRDPRLPNQITDPIANIVAGINYIRSRYGCLMLDATILTKRGWLKHDEVVVGDETIGYNLETRRSEWTRITQVHHYADADVVRLYNRDFEVICTPNHRWVSETRVQRNENTDRFCQVCGDNFPSARGAKHHMRIKHGVTAPRTLKLTYEPEFVETVGIRQQHMIKLAAPADTEGTVDITEAEAELLGWVAGDGHVRQSGNGPRRRMTLYQAKPAYVAHLQALLVGLPHTEAVRPPRQQGYLTRHEFSFGVKYTEDLLTRSGYAHGDPVMFVLSLSSAQRSAWLRGVVGAEGHQTRREGRTPRSDAAGWSITQVDGPVAEAMKLAVYLEGHRPSVSQLNAGTDGRRPSSTIAAATSRAAGGYLRQEKCGKAEVWCVTTELGSWTAQYEGQVFLTGNSIFNVQQANASAPPLGYDNGGYLPPGLTAVYNGTGRPERVLTDEQWARVGAANSLEGLSLVGAAVEVRDDGLMHFVDGRIERANQNTGSALARRTR